MKNLLSLEGRVALVTGAGQGIGRRAALHFAEHGCAAVLVNDYASDRAQAVAAEVTAAGSRGIPVVGDVTDYQAMERAIGRAAESAGGLNIVVNNAGNAGPTDGLENLPPFWETGPADWQKWLGTNLYGVLNVNRIAIPLMATGGSGSIVNVISDAGRVGEPHLAVYSAAKAGAAGLSRALAKALGPRKIRVNSVALGGVNTPGVQSMVRDEEAVRRSLKSYIIRRTGEPEDAANMILFLASDASSWITGQTYGVNGGYSTSQ
ncbi:SDR family NAD(P)-dependent oxidoreductase [Pseudorhodoferax sp.]|uniref:SDR family NAD(P)-dependent oxidoreductase n=1 Tax=Pseudorhodoferax sp. TaxID=1993553 RepID=UPI002DD633D7|nr:SDR family NAD(P)-dependent oxidoreductase [Pseudorhodoferax sp.]